MFSAIEEESIGSIETFARLAALQDNYNSDVRQVEDRTEEEQQEENAFLQAVRSTRVTERAYSFMVEKGTFN